MRSERIRTGRGLCVAAISHSEVLLTFVDHRASVGACVDAGNKSRRWFRIEVHIEARAYGEIHYSTLLILISITTLTSWITEIHSMQRLISNLKPDIDEKSRAKTKSKQKLLIKVSDLFDLL